MVNKKYLNTTFMIVGANQRSLIVQPPTALFEALANFNVSMSQCIHKKLCIRLNKVKNMFLVLLPGHFFAK